MTYEIVKLCDRFSEVCVCVFLSTCMFLLFFALPLVVMLAIACHLLNSTPLCALFCFGGGGGVGKQPGGCEYRRPYPRGRGGPAGNGCRRRSRRCEIYISLYIALYQYIYTYVLFFFRLRLSTLFCVGLVHTWGVLG